MDMWNRTFLRLTLIEWLVALVILLIVARFIWAEEVADFENSLFESTGLDGGTKYLIAVPLGIWVLYRLFKRERTKASFEGRNVMRPQVLAIAVGLLLLAAGFLVVSAR